MNIRIFSVASIPLAILTTGSTFAADLGSRLIAPAPYLAPEPVFSWTGFYVGLNAGAALNDTNDKALQVYYPSGATSTAYTDYTVYGHSANSVGFTGGGQIGFNWQLGSFVLGLETDLQYRQAGDNSLSNGAPAVPPNQAYFYGVSSSSDAGWFGTARARVGYAVNRALFYVTGGLAYGSHQTAIEAYYYSPNYGSTLAAYSSSASTSGLGYTIGGGIEYAVTPNWTIRGEYLYVDLGKKPSTLYTSAATPSISNGLPTYITANGGADRFSVARIGANYKF